MTPDQPKNAQVPAPQTPDEALLDFTSDHDILRVSECPGLEEDHVWFEVGTNNTLRYHGTMSKGLSILKFYLDSVLHG